MSGRRRRFAGWAPAVSSRTLEPTGRAHVLVVVGRRRPRLVAACAARCCFEPTLGAYSNPADCHAATGARPCRTCMQITAA